MLIRYLSHGFCHLECPRSVHIGHHNGNSRVCLSRITELEFTDQIHLKISKNIKVECVGVLQSVKYHSMSEQMMEFNRDLQTQKEQEKLQARQGRKKLNA